MHRYSGTIMMIVSHAATAGQLRLLRLAVSCFAAASIAVLCMADPALSDQPTLSVVTNRVLTPLISEQNLDAGFIEVDTARGVYALQVEIDPGNRAEGWILFMRSDRARFSPDGAGKACSDLMWKLDEEDSQSYRRLSDHEAVVLENPEGGRARIMLDVLIVLDWRTDPGMYGIELLFRTTFL